MAYGVPTEYRRGLVRYWRHDYDWRAAEARLNEWPQFTTTIDGANVHVAHVRSPEPDATPLIITHGWPGSIVEFLDVVGPLAGPAAHGCYPADALHVVVPGIPGFGLSGPAPDKGWEAGRVADAWAELTRRFGYERFGAQGGGWGAAISREPGRAHTPGVDGLGGAARGGRGPGPAADQRDAVLAELADRYGGSSARGSYERAHATGRTARPAEPSTAPTALALFPAAPRFPLRHKAEPAENLVRWAEFDRGGHCAAMEEPDLLVADVRAFFRQLREKGAG